MSDVAGGVLCVAILGFDSSMAIFYETLRRIVRTMCINLGCPKSMEEIEKALAMVQLCYRAGGLDAANVWLDS